MARITKKKEAQIKKLNQRIAKKKSNIKTRYGLTVDIPKIDPTLPYKTREKLIKQAEKFLDRKNPNYQYTKNEHGVVFTKAELKPYKELLKRVNKAKKKEREKLENMDYVVRGNTYGKHKDVLFNSIRDKSDYKPLKLDLNWFPTKKAYFDYTSKKQDVYSGDFLQRAKERYKENYLKALINEHGDTSYVRDLIGKLEQIPAKDFYFRSMSTGELDIRFVYDTSDSDRLLDSLSESWGFGTFMSGYRDEYDNFDLDKHRENVQQERRQLKQNRKKR